MHPAAHRLHTVVIPLRWGDMDALQHVNNTVYFRFMEQVRIDWLLRFGHVTSGDCDSPVFVTAGCEFLRPITYPANVEVSLYADPPGRTSLKTYYDIRVQGDPNPSARGEAIVVWISAHTKTSTPLPDWLRAAAP